MHHRVIPTLLLHKGGLTKTIRFKKHKYVGDPINAVKIFNEKEVDELVILDIDATKEKRPPNFDQIADIVSEAFMPVAYGGGITKLEEIKRLLYNGVEKVIIGKEASKNTSLLKAAVNQFGSQSIVVSVDYKRNWLNKVEVYVENGTIKVDKNIVDYAKRMEDAGVGELFIYSIDRDGMYKGYDISTIAQVSASLQIPIIACGGASDIVDFSNAIAAGASAVAAGSMFIFQRPHNAVLISYPNKQELFK